MNCECVYYNKSFSIDDYAKLGKKIDQERKELYPCTISKITKDIVFTTDYDGLNGTTIEIPKNSLVLFVQGKLLYMDITRQGAKVGFPKPMEEDWFLDIYDFDESGNIHKLRTDAEMIKEFLPESNKEPDQDKEDDYDY